MSHPSLKFQVEGLKIGTNLEGNQQKAVDLCESRGKKHEFWIYKLVLDIINPTNLHILFKLINACENF